MKKIYLSIAYIAFGLAFGQVGINTESPKTTLDVSPKKNASGIINPQLIGMQAPRLTRAELTSNTAVYGTDQTAALVYITDVIGGDTNTPRTFVDSVGYYYFDGVLWQKAKGAGGTGGTEPWYVRATSTEATLNTQNIYQKGNVAVGTNQGIGTFHIDAAKDNPTTGTPNATKVLDDIIVTPGGRVGFGYSPSDLVISGRQLDDKITFQANDDLDVNYSLATANNAQAIVHRNIISSGSIGSRGARNRATSIVAFEGHTSTFDGAYGGGSFITQQRAGVVLRTGRLNDLGGEIWFGTSGASNGGNTLINTAGNWYRAVMDQRGRWAFGADPNGEGYDQPSERLDILYGGLRIRAFANTGSFNVAERPNYLSTDPNDRIVVVDGNGVLKTIDRSVLDARFTPATKKATEQIHVIKNTSDITPAIIEGCPIYDSELLAQKDSALPKGGLYRIKGSGGLMIKY